MGTKKDWLIRTKDQFILGPISKNKLEQLIKNNSFALTDEICSGNGYWFRISEADLVKKYIFDGEKQGFNPILDSKIVHDVELNIDADALSDDQGTDNLDIKFPSDEDLTYPEFKKNEEKVKSDLYSDLKKENEFIDRREQKGNDYTLAYSLKNVEKWVNNSTPENAEESKELKDEVISERLEIPNPPTIEDDVHDDDPEENFYEEDAEQLDDFTEISVEKIEKKNARKVKRKSFKNLIFIFMAILIIGSILGFLFYRTFIPNAQSQESKTRTDTSIDLKKKV